MEPKSIKKVSSSEIGEHLHYDRNSLIGYISECFLKRVVKKHESEIVDYVNKKYNLNGYLKMKVELTNTIEKIEIVDNICQILTSLNSKECIKLKDIYESKGLYPMLRALSYYKPIHKV